MLGPELEKMSSTGIAVKEDEILGCDAIIVMPVCLSGDSLVEPRDSIEPQI